MEGFETFMAQNAWFHAQMCLFCGIVVWTHNHVYGSKSLQNPFCKTYIEKARRKSHVNGATMLKFYSYIASTCANVKILSARGRP